MGSETCRAVERAEDMELVGRADTRLDITLSAVLDGSDADVVVDFTQPDSALANIREATARGVHCVVGTTGFDSAELDGSEGANVLIAPNFAIGALLMMKFSEEAAKWMPAAEIVELHHPGKLDAPSGTAALTARRMEISRSASGGSESDVPIHSVRLPGLVAHQEVIFGSEGETLTIRHDSIDRVCFMQGVLAAVRGVGGLATSPTIGLDTMLWGAQ
jgi:4-hydroxy-tetrahydrodipicolinate reductase